jgi:hypothetical protein
MDAFGDVRTKLGESFPEKGKHGWRHDFVLMKRGHTQNERNQPLFTFKSYHSTAADAPTPMSIDTRTGRSWEKLRFRCSGSGCRHLGPNENLDDDLLGEIPRDDQTVDILSLMQQDQPESGDEDGDDKDEEAANSLIEAAGEDAKGGAEADATGDAKKPREVFTFTQPRGYYEPLLELGQFSRADLVIIVSATTHPNSWLVARSKVPNVFVLLERATPHSLAHAKELALQMLLRERLAAVL